MRTTLLAATTLAFAFLSQVFATPLPVSYWNGPSTEAMSKLANDLIAYNEIAKNHHCESIQFPALANSLIVYKQQLPLLEQAIITGCHAARLLARDSSTLKGLEQVDFYALSAFNYPTLPGTAHLLPAVYSNHPMQCSGLTGEVSGWVFTPCDSTHRFKFMITQ